ncbi:MAG TPA: hypothetical protein VEO54_11535 [Thermoanaerobaculia bacterium]|nr:hypothetical protein [Thermoanaerobaculia bacterium]
MLTPEEFIEQVRALRARVPELEPLPKERQTEYLKRVAKLDPEFTREAIGAVGASEVVQVVLGNTPDDLVRAEDEMNRWSLGESELRSLLHSVATANFVRRQRIGQAALEAYGVSIRLAKREEHAQLVPHVQQMRRLRKLSRRRPRAAAEPEPQPQLPPPQTKPV